MKLQPFLLTSALLLSACTQQAAEPETEVLADQPILSTIEFANLPARQLPRCRPRGRTTSAARRR